MRCGKFCRLVQDLLPCFALSDVMFGVERLLHHAGEHGEGRAHAMMNDAPAETMGADVSQHWVLMKQPIFVDA